MSNILKKIITNIYIRNIVLMAVIATLLIGITMFCLKKYTRHNESVEVPDLSGMQLSEINQIIKSDELKYEVVDSLYNEGGVPGSILEQIPQGNSKVKKGRTIYLTIQALNEKLVTIPDLEDASLRQADVILKGLGLKNIKIKKIPSQYQDLVFGVEYKGNKINPGSKVPIGATLYILVGDGNSASNDSIEEINISIDDSEIEGL